MCWWFNQRPPCSSKVPMFTNSHTCFSILESPISKFTATISAIIYMINISNLKLSFSSMFNMSHCLIVRFHADPQGACNNPNSKYCLENFRIRENLYKSGKIYYFHKNLSNFQFFLFIALISILYECVKWVVSFGVLALSFVLSI